MRNGIVTLLAALLLAGCGGGGGVNGIGVTPTSGPPAAVSTGAPIAITPAVTSPARATPTPVAAAGSPTRVTPTRPAATPNTGAASPTRATPRAASPIAAVAAPPVAFQAAPWRQAERTTYAIQDRDTGQQVGQATYVIGREFETDSLSANVTINQTQDRYQMGFNTRTFQPTSELRTVATAQGTIEIRAEYHQGGATIEVVSAGGTQRAELVLPPVYYANDQFLLLLRALPFADGYRGFLTLVPSQGNPPQIPTTVTVVGQETVTTPLGPIRAWRVEADFNGNKQDLWYGVEGPHYLVKYDNGRYVWLLSQAQRPQ